MNDDLKRQLLDEVDAELGPRPQSDLSDVLRRGRAKRLGIRLIATASMILVGTALVTGAIWIAGARSLSSDEALPPANPQPEEAFADVGGWIAYRGVDGIWAVDPARPERKIRLSRADGSPIAWSNDGTKLLIRRLPTGDSGGPSQGLYVLEADGAETRLTDRPFDASLSPDGSEVVYATSPSSAKRSAIYKVSSDGGAPRLIARSTRRIYFPELERSYLSFISPLDLSPDGTRIAYFDGYGDHSHKLWVMNADGTKRRQVLDDEMSGAGHMNALTWSPDGEWLAFTTDDGIYLVRPDGTGFRLLVRGDFVQAAATEWSTDGSRIVYYRPGATTSCGAFGAPCETVGSLSIVNVNGGGEQVIEGIRTPENTSIAWNPAV